MDPHAVPPDARRPASRGESPGLDTRRLGLTLRTVYEGGIDAEPITDAQVELLLRLRQKERELRRAG